MAAIRIWKRFLLCYFLGQQYCLAVLQNVTLFSRYEILFFISPWTFVCCRCCRSVVCYANDAYQMSTASDKVENIHCAFSKLVFVLDTLKIYWRLSGIKKKYTSYEFSMLLWNALAKLSQSNFISALETFVEFVKLPHMNYFNRSLHS